VVAGPSKELTDRANVHLSICNQHLERGAANQFKDGRGALRLRGFANEHWRLRDRPRDLEKLLKQNAKADYVVYGLAALDCLTGHSEDSLRHLDEALRLNAHLRFQARNDSDFQNLAEDPRFTELLYPDPGAELDASDRRLRGEEPAVASSELQWTLESPSLGRRRTPHANGASVSSPSAAAPAFLRCSRDSKRFVLSPAEILQEPNSPSIGDLSAVVTVSDDGGSSGRLRKELNMLPPGDIRNCIVASAKMKLCFPGFSVTV